MVRHVAVATEPDNKKYLRLLLILLVSAAFFEGYDGSILALLLPNIQSTFRVSEATLGLTRIPIELGLFVAFFVTRLSDRLGRRPLLLWSVIGYTAFTAATAFSWDIWSFAFFQFGSRIFLGAEYAVGVTMIVEEYPAGKRGRALGTLLTFSALGTIAVGLLIGVGLQDSGLGWRAFYLVGLVPLLLLIPARRRLRETQRFIEMREERAPRGSPRRGAVPRTVEAASTAAISCSSASCTRCDRFRSSVDRVVGVLRRARTRLHRDRSVDLHHRRRTASAASATTCAGA